jgi:hypothetical protein
MVVRIIPIFMALLYRPEDQGQGRSKDMALNSVKLFIYFIKLYIKFNKKKQNYVGLLIPSFSKAIELSA